MSVLPSLEAMVVVILFVYTLYMLSKTFAWDEQFDSLIKARKKIEELEAENARLRQENQSIGMAAYELGRKSMADENAKLHEDNNRLIQAIEDLHNVSLEDELVQLENENAKLRELVRHMGACIQYLDRSDEDGGCVLCPYQSVEHDCEFESRICELGIVLGRSLKEDSE